jgi:branched-chain amino acid transport system substrate-binding protein
MSYRIGVLLPRSTDYPSIGFDILDGVRCYFKQISKNEIQFISENIGFGEDAALNYAKAEKLILQDEVDMIIAYSNPKNAEPLYLLAETTQKPFIFLDAGIQHPENMQHPFAFHISLQGMETSFILGAQAAEGKQRVLKTTSFYEGGYRTPWAAVKGVESKNAIICGNYVSAYRVSDFTITKYLELLEQTQPQAIVASFSTYLAELFMSSLKQAGANATMLPFYCSSFMAEEQQLQKWDFPGGTFHTVIPWATLLNNNEQHLFTETIKEQKNKTATIFHLLGWEAGIVVAHILANRATPLVDILKGWSYMSPRGKQTFHPDTHYTYGPLYYASIIEGENKKCALSMGNQIPADASLHVSLFKDRPENSSDWKNNYLCI